MTSHTQSAREAFKSSPRRGKDTPVVAMRASSRIAAVAIWLLSIVSAVRAHGVRRRRLEVSHLFAVLLEKMTVAIGDGCCCIRITMEARELFHSAEQCCVCK